MFTKMKLVELCRTRGGEKPSVKVHRRFSRLYYKGCSHCLKNYGSNQEGEKASLAVMYNLGK